MTIEYEAPQGATPLNPEELEQLIPLHITSMADLNAAEQMNIVQADMWAFSRNRKELLEIKYVQALHKRMFGDVWLWAGRFRQRNVNIGDVDAYEVPARLHLLFGDVQYWLENNTYPIDVVAVRFHREITWIHPFVNGNGRHARLMTDLILKKMGSQRFSWGGGDLVNEGKLRSDYLEALRAADNQDFQPLLDFCRL